MDARQLKFFLAVIDYGGFSRAAEQLFIAQPSLSQTIAGLERELGVTLFHRVGRGVLPSDAAQRLIGPARQVMRDLATAQSAIDAVKGITTGQVEIISMPSPAVEPLTTIMTGFVNEHPDITISVAAAFEPDDVLRAVRTGEVEIGLLGAPTPVKAADLRVLPIEDQELVLITAPDGPLAAAGTITPIDLTGHRLVVAPKGSLMRALVDDMLSSGVQAKIVAEAAHRTSILPMVLAGVADAVLPAGWSSLALGAGARVVRIQPPSHLHIAMVSRTTPLTPAAAAFVLAGESYTVRSATRY
jgi:DNA-binding transcriptional LysR family regulator